MNYQRFLTLFIVSLALLSCNTKQKEVQLQAINNNHDSDITKLSSSLQTDKAAKLVEATIAAHGGDSYNKASYSFIFRKKTYTFTNTQDSYVYSVSSEKNGNQVVDSLVNGRFNRFISNEEIALSKKEQNKHKEALNSVIYFATLPYKLKDQSVRKTYLGTTQIKDKNYTVLGVTFIQEGGGKDYDDIFHYWINQESQKIDYLAYSYHVNGGGVRFRSAYNKRVIDGVTFQDYVNYKAPNGTPLLELPVRYEAGELKELSRIETEKITNLNSK